VIANEKARICVIERETQFAKRPRFDRRSKYEAGGPQDQFIVPLLKQHIEEALNTYGKSTSLQPLALDVGCGRQPFRQNLEDLGYKYISIDAQQDPEGIVDIVCEIDQPLPPSLTSLGTFDFILCTEVMEHVVNWDMAFSNFSKLLSSGGRLFITCPHFYQLHEEPHDYWRATPYALQHYGNKFGLNVIHQVNAGNAWDVLGTVLGSCYSVPVNRKLYNVALNKIVSKIRSFLLRLLTKQYLQKRILLNGLLYLSNIVVYEKTK